MMLQLICIASILYFFLPVYLRCVASTANYSYIKLKYTEKIRKINDNNNNIIIIIITLLNGSAELPCYACPVPINLMLMQV